MNVVRDARKNESEVFSIEDLDASRKEEMFLLLRRHFDGATSEQFEKDLSGKNWVIQLRMGGRLSGFSTLCVYEMQYHDELVTVVYSGDTIVTPEAWGTTELARTWISSVWRLRSKYPRGKMYWLLLTSGFRTYRFLPVFWQRFHPSHDDRARELQPLLDHLASAYFRDEYISELGIVRFRSPQVLHGSLLEVPAGRRSDPHISYFLQRNPSYILGDELVCIAELHPSNLTKAGRRVSGPVQ
jgi:hypothetical protein